MTTGIVRRLDDLGRICIPREIRRTLGLEEGAALEINIENNKLVLSQYMPMKEDELAACLEKLAIYYEDIERPNQARALRKMKKELYR